MNVQAIFEKVFNIINYQNHINQNHRVVLHLVRMTESQPASQTDRQTDRYKEEKEERERGREERDK